MGKILCGLSAAVLLSISGCNHWFREDRPVPVKPPYEPTRDDPAGKLSDAEAVNAMTTAISIRTATSGWGPFVFVEDKNFPCSKLGMEVLGSLYRMGISSPSGRLMLVLYDEITPKGEWTVRLVHYKTDKVFFTRTLILSR
ncbi:MAG: hypothetical protein BWY31_02077 [Lentisphaerae bacterium ADurb.Bin242]|nr:MAG: hypothetical protein BWY31_02077 [Lentisphaerae bacterium ADurb.Bin242]